MAPNIFFPSNEVQIRNGLGTRPAVSFGISGGPSSKKNFVCGLIKFPGGDEETAGTGNAKTQTDGVKGVVVDST